MQCPAHTYMSGKTQSSPVTSAYFQNSSMAVPHSTVLEMCMAQVGRLSALAGSACTPASAGPACMAAAATAAAAAIGPPMLCDALALHEHRGEVPAAAEEFGRYHAHDNRCSSACRPYMQLTTAMNFFVYIAGLASLVCVLSDMGLVELEDRRLQTCQR